MLARRTDDYSVFRHILCVFSSCSLARRIFLKKIVDLKGNKMREKTLLMDGLAVERSIKRISHEIVEKNKGVDNLVLLGIVTRGVPFSQKIAQNILIFEGKQVAVGTVDISFYRDDIKKIAPTPILNGCNVPCDINDKDVILCDDVLYTGRTARAAMEAVLSIGRPKTIQLAVLVDRGHRELPIRADYVGKNVPTTVTEIIKVCFLSTDNDDGVKLYDLD